MASPLELVEQHYRNVSSANIAAEDELFSPDVETIDPGAGTLRGLQAFKMYEEGFQRAFPDGKLVLKSAIEAGNKVAAEGAYTGRTPAHCVVRRVRSRPPIEHSTWSSRISSTSTITVSSGTASTTTRSSS